MAKFCGKCGTRLDELTGLCPNCDDEKLIALQKEIEKQKEIVYKKKFCNQCGSPLDENGLCPKCDKAKIAALKKDDGGTEETPPVNKQRFCNQCGSLLDENGQCPNCNQLKDRVADEEDNEEKPKKGHRVLKIVGMIVGSLLIIAIVAIAIYFLINTIIKKDTTEDTNSDEDTVAEVAEEEETTNPGIAIYTYDYSLEVGEYADIDINDNGNSYSVVSNDADVVSYTNGQLYGVGAGDTTVTVTYDTEEYTLNVTVVGEDDDDEYIFANSSTELLTDSDVENLSSDELRIARNEIYARHGCYFEDDELQAYFESCSWYENKNIKALDYSSLSDIEKANIDLIKSYE